MPNLQGGVEPNLQKVPLQINDFAMSIQTEKGCFKPAKIILICISPYFTTLLPSVCFSSSEKSEKGTVCLANSRFACDIIAAILVYNNNRVVITFFCCVHQLGRHTLCHFNFWGLSTNQELLIR